MQKLDCYDVQRTTYIRRRLCFCLIYMRILLIMPNDIGTNGTRDGELKGSNVPSIRNLVVDEERMRLATGLGQCSVFPSVL